MANYAGEAGTIMELRRQLDVANERAEKTQPESILSLRAERDEALARLAAANELIDKYAAQDMAKDARIAGLQAHLDAVAKALHPRKLDTKHWTCVPEQLPEMIEGLLMAVEDLEADLREARP